MKKMLLLIMLCGIIYACGKEQVVVPIHQNFFKEATPVNRTMQTEKAPNVIKINRRDVGYVQDGGTLDVDYSYTLADDPNCLHCYWCPPPKIDCSKIRKPSGTVLGTIIDEFRDAVNQGQVQEFFTDERWKKILPHLANRPGDIQKLQSGELTIVKKLNINIPKSEFYIALPPSDTINIILANTRFTIQLMN